MMRRYLGRRRSQRLDAMVANAAGPLQADPTPTPTSLALETVAPRIIGAPKHGSLPYLPGLDGLRALAVLAVLLFHGRASLLPGGFLGVDVFFVISGFIITRLLLNEWQTTGGIALGSFWIRRAKRLLPAVYLLLVAVLLYYVFFQEAEVTNLRSDALSALAYVTNWRFIADQQSYFETFMRPSAFRHLWSLAVEEQFYIAWPLLLAGSLALFKRRWVVALLVVAGAIASTALMAYMYSPGDDVSRVYYGTDTRAGGLLIGVAVAFLVSGVTTTRRLMARLYSLPARVALDLGAVLALATLAGCMVLLEESSTFLYQGGLAGIALVTAVVILATSNPRTMTSRLLGVKPLRWLGERSYSIYLWHWPILLLAWPEAPSDLQLVGMYAATIAIAAASYHFVEQPLRRIDLAKAWRAFRAAGLMRRTAVATSGMAAGMMVASLAIMVTTASEPDLPDYFDTPHVVISGKPVTQSQDVVSVLAPASATSAGEPFGVAPGGLPGGPSELALPADQQTAMIQQLGRMSPEEAQQLLGSNNLEEALNAIAPPMAETVPEQALADRRDCEEMRGTAYRSYSEREFFLANCIRVETVAATSSARIATIPSLQPVTNARVTAIGDSVMLGAAPQMASLFPNIDFDSAVSRQVSVAIQLLRQRAASNALGDYVVIAMGNNGTFTAGQFDEIMSVIGPNRKAIFVTVKVARSWEGGNNQVIRDGVSRYPNAALADWRAVSQTREDFFWSDLIHLRPEGAYAYATLIAPFMK
jgi:peptidoglycan/LPS O-acetylase OafA/YrhL